MKIKTSFDATALFTTFQWSAIDDDTYDLDEPVGYGSTEQEAIEDLLWQINERNEEAA